MQCFTLAKKEKNYQCVEKDGFQNWVTYTLTIVAAALRLGHIYQANPSWPWPWFNGAY